MAWRAREEEGSGDDVMGRLGEWERWVFGVLGECWRLGVLGRVSDEMGEESM